MGKLLFQPGLIGNLELKNRIIMPPMVTINATKEGYATESIINYYKRRAQGGAGLIIVEAAGIEPRGKVANHVLRIDSEATEAGLAKLAEEIKKAGAKAAIQLAHCGRQGSSKSIGQQKVAPSPIPHPFFPKDIPKELNIEEIKELVELYAQAVYRAKKVGFDAVDIHGAHGYLICQFLSELTNERQDEYGGSLQNRARFALEIVNRARQLVGNEFPIIFRLSVSEYVKGGLEELETHQFIKWLEEAGVDAINVSAGNYQVFHVLVQPMMSPRGTLVPHAAKVKQITDLPVIGVGRINNPELAEYILYSGQADFIAMGRPLIADPNLPNKAKEDKSAEIRKCIACNTCLEHTFKLKTVRCQINPQVGDHDELPVIKSDHPKNVFVVGAGPAGMEAARVLALRGHDVTLWEKDKTFGGALKLAHVPPGKEEYKELIDYYVYQLAALGVKLRLGEEFTLNKIENEKADVLIVAAGAQPIIPQIEGIDNNNVFMAEEVLAKQLVVGEKVIVIGGSLVGCETALFLGDKGSKVTIMRRSADIGKEYGGQRDFMMQKLQERQCGGLTNVQYKRIKSNGVEIEHDGKEQFIEADAVIIAAGYRPNQDLFVEAKSKGLTAFSIGDAVEPRGVMEAIREGWQVANSI